MYTSKNHVSKHDESVITWYALIIRLLLEFWENGAIEQVDFLMRKPKYI